MILALDTATNTGWALRLGEMIHSGAQNFQHDAKRESPGMRFLRFSKWLRQMISEHAVTLVVYEQPHQRGGGPTTVGVGLVAHLLSVCAELGIEHASVHGATLKKASTGKGNAGKPEMVEAASKILGRQVDSHDEADAVLLLRYAEENL